MSVAHQTDPSKTHLLREVVLFASLALMACSQPGVPGPKEVLEQYLEAALDLRDEEAYGYLSERDRRFKSLEEYLAQDYRTVGGYLPGRIGGKASFKIESIEQNGDIATAQVQITGPDVEAMVGSLLGSAFQAAFSGASEEELQKKMEKEAESIEEPPMKTVRPTFTLVNELGGWKIFAFEQEIRSEEERAAYMDSIELYDFVSSYTDSYTRGRIPVVDFKLRNRGNRTLKRVEVTVYFEDENGIVVHEESLNPVWVSDSAWNDSKPLKPNYVWENTSGDYWRSIENVPSEWKEGATSARVTDVEFE